MTATSQEDNLVTVKLDRDVVARLCWLLDSGKRLTQAEVVGQVLAEWRAAKTAEVPKVPKTP